MTAYEKFKIYLLSNELDPKLAEPVFYAPELCDLYPWPKLVLALSLISDDFKPVSTSVSLKPIINGITKLSAFKSDEFISAHINNILASNSKDLLRLEILHRMARIFKEQIA